MKTCIHRLVSLFRLYTLHDETIVQCTENNIFTRTYLILLVVVTSWALQPGYLVLFYSTKDQMLRMDGHQIAV